MLISKWFFGFIFLLFVLTSENSFGQSGRGCLMGTTLYPDFDGGPIFPYYKNSNPKPTQEPACPRVDLLKKTGRNCRIGFFSFDYGEEYTYTTLTAPFGCPIDDYVPLVLISAGGLGFLYLRGRII